jgi:hypothetical protein
MGNTTKRKGRGKMDKEVRETEHLSIDRGATERSDDRLGSLLERTNTIYKSIQL